MRARDEQRKEEEAKGRPLKFVKQGTRLGEFGKEVPISQVGS